MTRYYFQDQEVFACDRCKQPITPITGIVREEPCEDCTCDLCGQTPTGNFPEFYSQPAPQLL